MDASRNDSPDAAPLARGAGALRRAVVALLMLAPVALAAPAAGDEAVRSGKWNPKDAPPGWVVIETKHYQVQGQCGKAKAQALADHLEGMLALYRKFMPTRRKLDGFVLKLFKDRKAFLDYSHMDGAAAYYSQDAGELVGYDTGIILGKRDVPAVIKLAADSGKGLTNDELKRLDGLFEAVTDAYTMDTARILSHEGWHQYFHFYTVSIVRMPSWLDEGVGDYFFMAARDDSPEAKGGYRLGDLNKHRMRALQRAFVDGSSVSFQKLLGFAQDQYYSNPGVFYAQGWSMVQFLMQNADESLRETIPKLIKDFKDTKNFEKSTAKVFKGVDMEALDRAWVGWVLSEKVDDPLRTLAQEFGSKLKVTDLQAEERITKVYQWYVDHPDDGPAATAAAPPAAAGTPPPANPPPGKGDGKGKGAGNGQGSGKGDGPSPPPQPVFGS